MTRLKTTLTGLAIIAWPRNQVWAADSAGFPSGSGLTGLFIGFCVLLVVLQMVPTLMLIVGAVKGLFGKNGGRKLGQNI